MGSGNSGKQLGRWRAGVAALMLATSAYACIESSSSTTSGSNSSGGPGSGVFDRTALLTSLTNNVILVTLADFAAQAKLLRDAAASYGVDPSADNRDVTQQTWLTTMAAWQRLELMQFGPAGSATNVIGGQDLREELYSWPVVNRCRVDQETVAESYSDLDALRSEPVNVRGLDALEYLLFNSASSNLCPPQNVVNTSGDWDSIANLDQRRADYAAALAELLLERAISLHDTWTSGYADAFRSAGSGSSDYDSAQRALNAISDGMFYLDSKTKDVKIAVPAGLSDCINPTCPEKLELAFSGASKMAIEQNVIAFDLLFTGGESDALGFDDWLIAVGAPTLALDVAKAVAAAKQSLSEIEEDDLKDALANDPQSVEALYFAVKQVTDIMKADVVTVLDLDLPNDVQGDND